MNARIFHIQRLYISEIYAIGYARCLTVVSCGLQKIPAVFLNPYRLLSRLPSDIGAIARGIMAKLDFSY
jgi:hypothetical protein